jgi:GntR family transcriptional repressor for pyruvate dehydrogenase complex
LDAPQVAFTAVRRTRVFEGVAQQIQRLIADGALKPGERLPAERELAARLSVSRSSVRDAIRILELAGLVVPRQGEGTVVADLSPENVTAPIASMLVRKRALIAELIDVRKMIEPALAARAAERATPEDVERLEEILERQAAKAQRGESTVEEDTEFHYQIALAAQNAVVQSILDVLMQLLRETRTRTLQTPGRPRRSLEGHRRILAAIRRRDPKAAERAVRRHLGEIETIVMKKL